MEQIYEKFVTGLPRNAFEAASPIPAEPQVGGRINETRKLTGTLNCIAAGIPRPPSSEGKN